MKIELDIKGELDARPAPGTLSNLFGDLQYAVSEAINSLERWKEIEISIEFVVPDSEKQSNQCRVCCGMGYPKTDNLLQRQCWFCKGLGHVNKSDVMTGICLECDGRGQIAP